MAIRLEHFFDYGSPFSYLANTQLAALGERTGAEIVYRPMLLGGLFKAVGNSPPINVPAKANHLSTDLLRWAKHYGVAVAFNPHFPINTVGLMRGALAALELSVFPAYHQAIFHAMWGEPTNLGDEKVVRQVLEKAGLDAQSLLELAQQQQIKDRLRQSTEEAATRGAFGAPTFFVGEEMFFGNDRMEFVEAALRRGA